MVHPVFIDDTQHDDTLDLTHDGNTVRIKAEFFLPFGINTAGSLAHGLDYLIGLGLAA